MTPYCCCHLRRVDYTHVIFIGTNELNRVVQAITRYALGAAIVGPGYQDPVDFDRVFEVQQMGCGCPVVSAGAEKRCRLTPWSRSTLPNT